MLNRVEGPGAAVIHETPVLGVRLLEADGICCMLRTCRQKLDSIPRVYMARGCVGLNRCHDPLWTVTVDGKAVKMKDKACRYRDGEPVEVRFDEDGRRLIYLWKKSSADQWDNHWSLLDGDDLRARLSAARSPRVVRITRRFLGQTTHPVLEGGCGLGIHVAALRAAGYRCVGVDYAGKTLERIKSLAPELDLRQANLEALPFPDGYFDGYWSMGVIEHNAGGYLDLATEMARVLAPNGYLFLSFPVLNPLRRLKARLGLYPTWDGSGIDRYYQAALGVAEVVRDMSRFGFKHVSSYPYDFFTGLQEEFGPRTLRIVEFLSSNPVGRAVGYCLAKTLAPLMGHTVTLVLRKCSDGSP